MKFKIGEAVHYRPLNRRKEGPRGPYEVTRLLPHPENSEPEYRIRNQGQERDVKESELKAAVGNKR